MNPVYEKLMKCYESVRAKTGFVPKAALILGSGLGNYGERIRVETIVDYHEIAGFPVSTVPGHAGRFLFGYVGETPVVCMQGRVHYYEGYDMADVVLPVRLMKRMGAEILFLTNAAGGIRQGMHAGDLMLITGQIASFVPSPLRGPNIDELGVRFPDMSQIYDKDLQRTARAAALKTGVDLYEGTYLQLPGPQFETHHVPHARRGRGRHEHGLRGGGGKAYGHEGDGDFLYFQYGKRDLAGSADPRGGTGDGGSDSSEI